MPSNPPRPTAMYTLEEARAEMLTHIAPLPAETIPLAQAANRVLAAEVRAAVNLPRFDNSAMDGYAVRAAEANKGATLKCIGEVPAGSSFENELGAGECVRIFTRQKSSEPPSFSNAAFT